MLATVPPPVRDLVWNGPVIAGLMFDLADALPAGERHRVILAGGALLAWHGLRRATPDVDCVVRLDPAVKQAAAAVARQRGLDPHWLNDSAAMFAPQGLREDDCDLLMAGRGLVVLGVPLRWLLLMKLNGARPQDREDLAALWPLAGFTSPQDAAEAYVDAYPHEDVDPYLANYIAGIATKEGLR